VPKEEAETEWRQAFIMEREGAAQSYSVSLRLKDGRDADGFATSLYLRHKWLDRDSKTERLVWIFSNGGIYVEGQHLKRGLDALEEGKLKRIQEQDSNEIALIQSHNADVRKPEDKEPIVSRVVISPKFEVLLEDDENLIEIAKAIKEDYVHNTGGSKGPAR
jgi:hypothetical protein